VNKAFAEFLTFSEQDRRDVFEAAAARLDTLPSYVEKDLWVCIVLDVIFNGLPDGHPRLLSKVVPVHDEIDVFGEPVDQAEDLRQRRSALEQQPRVPVR